MDDIEERLRSHAQAFDGLLSLIPAKYYYGDDNTDQWQRKKQTKEQAREAKRAKLDPESGKTAKDVMDENARKRKREDGTLETDSSEDEELGSENPREGLNRGDKVKKQKQAEKSDATTKAKSEEAEARKKQKEEKKAQKKAAQKEKKKAKETAKREKVKESEQPSSSIAETSEPPSQIANGAADQPENSDEEDGDDLGEAAEEGFSIEFNVDEDPSSASSTRNSPSYDASNPQSGSSSISSIIPPSTSADAKSSEPKALKPTPEDLKQRLQKRLDELRAKRHADGFDGKPARNRQELIEARRQKAEQRKAHKKELRQKAKEEEQLKKDEAMARRFSPGGSGSLLASPRSPAESVGSSGNNFSFGRVVFADGQHTDASLSNIRDQHKSHGPTDAAAQLKAARLAEMSSEQRADVEEKDRWLNAKKRAHGERVRDDTSLLKKALKRKETAKKKSEREWKDRLDTVTRMKDQRQTKREENLRKRREEKGNKGSKGSKGKKPTGGNKKKARPGFEGSFKAKVGGKKK
ncbi:hypothetical protein N7462_007291 [Penicillium macrosclerotiorum]|uniref:uncharacterized protein n=1 Tax=Penicillium macrosclerotiorum TaxID=303699 RepID=UPI0025488EBC|nr:uncharacterized protein N7462_007291 [Penicillium macrosclerotiorum]KAJ5679047.1 hypothetical protein N7462_007291 [Penicillium macrosclerotiorum]